MEITDQLLIDLNIFRNRLITMVEEIEDNEMSFLIKKLKMYYDDIIIQFMSPKLDELEICELCQKISSVLFLINQRLNNGETS